MDYIIVTVTSARKLKSTGLSLGSHDIYFKMWTKQNRDKIYKTKVYENGGTLAIWQETFEVQSNDLSTDIIFVEILSKHLLADKVIGRLKIFASEVPNKPEQSWYSIFDEDGAVSGEVQMAVSLKPRNSAWSGPASQGVPQPLNGPGIQQPINVGGFQQPMYSGGLQQPINTGFQQPMYADGFQQPMNVGGFQQPMYAGGFQQPMIVGGFQQPMSIGGFQQPNPPMGSISTIGGFQQPTTINPHNRIGGLTTLQPSNLNVQYSNIDGFSTINEDRAVSQGTIGGMPIPNVTHNAQYVPHNMTGQITLDRNNAYAPDAILTSNAVTEQHTSPSLNTLPPNWEERRTPEGRLYYVNHVDKITSWDRPTTVSSIPAQTYSLVVEDNNKKVTEKRIPEVSASVLEPLPSDWEEKTTPEGRKYYVNHSLKITTWDRPNSTLPAGWEQRVTPEGKVYYINHVLKTTSWDRPLS
jgi:hypothetical protein